MRRLVAMGAGLLCLGLAANAAGQARATDPLRIEHKEMAVVLNDMEDGLEVLPKMGVSWQRFFAWRMVAYLENRVRAHDRTEANAVYPVVDELSGSQAQFPFTMTARFEAFVIEGHIAELGWMARATPFDAAKFARKGYGLLALIRGHFAGEEQVFYPLIDGKLTRL